MRQKSYEKPTNANTGEKNAAIYKFYRYLCAYVFINAMSSHFINCELLNVSNSTFLFVFLKLFFFYDSFIDFNVF